MERTIELIASADDAACAIDHNRRITFWNNSAERLFGYTLDEVRGAPCFSVFGGTDETGCLICHKDCDILHAATAQRPVGAREMHSHTKDGCELWLGISALFVPSRWHDVSVVIYLIRDITRRVSLECDLRNLLQRVKSEPDDHPRPDCLYHSAANLTARESQVLRSLAYGLSTARVASTLFISEATVRNHVRHIFSKLNVHNRLEAVTLAQRVDLL